jgi:hypothetical protein
MTVKKTTASGPLFGYLGRFKRQKFLDAGHNNILESLFFNKTIIREGIIGPAENLSIKGFRPFRSFERRPNLGPAPTASQISRQRRTSRFGSRNR